MRNLSGKRVTVVGMARSGTAAVELLVEKGAIVRAVDEKVTGEVAGVRIEPQNEAAFTDADLVVLSPGVPADLDVLHGRRVIGDLELASWFLQGPIIGITGSNGKTTTTALTGHILLASGVPCQVGGNIGTPPCSMVKPSRADQWNVLELSSFQLETIEEFRAQIGVALNITPDHLDRHHSLENYAAAKRRLFETQEDGDYAVLNADDATCVEYAKHTKGTPVWFSLQWPVSSGMWLADEVLHYDREVLMRAADVPLRGRHNLENVMAASIACRLAGALLEPIAGAVKTFPGVEHRIEFVRRVGGVDYYNDSKATNVDATLKSIDAFPGGLWIILGGKDKDSDYTVLREPLLSKARAALLIGAAAEKIKNQIGNAVPIVDSGTIEQAIRTAAASAVAGETVLLAPACASFDQFNNYEHRGKVFKELVNQL
ncbi:MAG TPA: UDP-N-acetylmuramoyl-L-alanine--D-glutamate ligase [Bryobacteraceae bacterium]|nr:UDP-N-acetylmuramoyl-L-alanine--D-glutamate ligase [Bryobacteraceae bacterium]